MKYKAKRITAGYKMAYQLENGYTVYVGFAVNGLYVTEITGNGLVWLRATGTYNDLPEMFREYFDHETGYLNVPDMEYVFNWAVDTETI